jgi:PD-(D/E)XK nuclease superfamily
VRSVPLVLALMKNPPNRAGELEPDERASLEALVETVVGAAYEVSNVLGAGFLDKIYERTLIEELSSRDLRVKAQAPFGVAYKGKHIGTFT